MSDIATVFQNMLEDVVAGADRGLERYRNDRVGFFRDVLRVDTWSKQEDLLHLVDEHDWVSCVSGHRVSKTFTAGGCALHFVATHGAGARVMLTGPSGAQVHQALWRETRVLHARARGLIGGDAGILGSTGIRWDDGRQIVCRTADTIEAIQGFAGPDVMIIVDEASGVDIEGRGIWDAIISNLAGGGILLLFSNPVRASGFFFESQKSERFARLHISSEHSPNVTGEKFIKGLATRSWLNDCAMLWGGVEGMLYKIRCKGEFVEASVGRMFPADMLTRSEDAHATTPATGRLVLGLDPAGEGGDGDASGFVARRGLKIVHADVKRALTPKDHLIEVLGLIATHHGDPREGETLVLVDRDGLVGHRVWVELDGYASAHEGAFKLVGVRGSENAKRRPLEIDTVRDELWFSLVDAFGAGLAIPTNSLLAGDLAAIRFDKLVNGRAKVVRKNVIRRELGGRSPDLGDALALACYESMGRGGEDRRVESFRLPAVRERDNEARRPIAPTYADPYGGFSRRRR